MCDETQVQETANRKGGGVRILKWGSIAAVCLILLLFFGVPLFLSSSGGTRFLVGKINTSVDGQLQMDDFSMGWIKGIKLTGLSYADSAGHTSVTVDRFQTRPKYISLLTGRVKLGKTVIDSPKIYLQVPAVEVESPKIESRSLPGAPTRETASPPLIPVNQIDLELINGSATVELTGDMPQKVSFTNIASKVQFDQPARSGSMDITMNVNESALLSAKGNVKTHKTGWMIHAGDFDVKVSKLQLADLKPLFALAGLQVDMAGELNADATIKIDGNKVEQLKADAAITDFSQGVGDQRVVFEEPVTIHAVVSGMGKDVQVKTAKIRSEFCNLDCSGTLESMDYALDADLARLQPIIEPFTDMGGVSIAGAMSARGRAGMTDGQVHLISENSKIQRLKISVPDSEPFVQDQVTLDADVLVDMDEKTVDIQSLNLQGNRGETLINVTKGTVKKKVSNAQTQLSGQFEAEYDWQVLSAFASAYLPQGLSVKGKRKSTLHFESEYPTDSPEQMITNLNADGVVGFDSASYFGMNFGPTELKANVQKGILNLQIPQTTVNEGTLQFAGTIDLNEESKILRLKEPMPILDRIHINDRMTNTMLKYLSPIFAGQSNISGFASLTCDKLEIPFDVDENEKMVINGVVEMDKVRLKVVGAVGAILAMTSSRSEIDARLLPSRILLQNGVMQYDEMEFHLDKYPTGFSGKIYLDKTLDMEVFVPYKFDVDRLRFPTVKIGEDLSDRLPLRVERGVDDPDIRLDKLFDSILKKHSPELIQRGIEELLKNL